MTSGGEKRNVREGFKTEPEPGSSRKKRITKVPIWGKLKKKQGGWIGSVGRTGKEKVGSDYKKSAKKNEEVTIAGNRLVPWHGQ